MPPKSMLLQADPGRSGGDLSAGRAASRAPAGPMGVENKSRLVSAALVCVFVCVQAAVLILQHQMKMTPRQNC